MEPIQHGNLEHGHYDLGFPGGSVEKNLPANERVLEWAAIAFLTLILITASFLSPLLY